jgi:hypothetical protein
MAMISSIWTLKSDICERQAPEPGRKTVAIEEGVLVTRRILMKYHFQLLAALLLAMAIVAGCATDSDSPALYVGMSRDRLKARFGPPLRIEHSPAGGEDWYYSFPGSPDVQTSRYLDESTKSDSTSITISGGAGTEERPVHLSPDGYVIEPLPQGHIVR